jgi:hypothetical protein
MRICDESGTAVVEFAVVATLLFLVVFGILDFGRAMNYWNDATQMANEGARWAVVDNNPGGSGQSLQQYILSQGDTAELRGNSKVCISFPGGTANVGDPVKVTVSMQFGFLPFISTVALGGTTSTTLTGAAEMRIEQKPTSYSEGCSS